MVTTRRDPYLSFRFCLEVDGLEVAGFSELSGLAAETDVLSYHEGGVNTHPRQLPGVTRHPDRLALKRGITDSVEIWEWYHDVTRGIIRRRSGAIKLLSLAGSAEGEAKRQWEFTDAYPARWVGPVFRAGEQEVAFETVELVHGGVHLTP